MSFLGANFCGIRLSFHVKRLLFFIIFPFTESPDHFVKFFELSFVGLYVLKAIGLALVIKVIVIVSGDTVESFTWLGFIFELAVLMSFVDVECWYGGACFCQF